jgi:hypothetical protein
MDAHPIALGNVFLRLNNFNSLLGQVVFCYCPSPHQVEEKRRFIDARIAELNSTILRLKTQRNELAPISKLPPEILARIFDFASSSNTNRPAGDHSTRGLASTSPMFRSIGDQSRSIRLTFGERYPLQIGNGQKSCWNAQECRIW